ncbi:MAG: 50S ribosomal protein L29 [Candidatus Absconditicoccaceae bacterium]
MKGKGLFMKELSDKGPKELVSMRKKMKSELYALKMKNSIRGLKTTNEIGDTRKKIARVNTVLKSKIKEKYDDNMK